MRLKVATVWTWLILGLATSAIAQESIELATSYSGEVNFTTQEAALDWTPILWTIDMSAKTIRYTARYSDQELSNTFKFEGYRTKIEGDEGECDRAMLLEFEIEDRAVLIAVKVTNSERTRVRIFSEYDEEVSVYKRVNVYTNYSIDNPILEAGRD